jgi:hypothetical protein
MSARLFLEHTKIALDKYAQCNSIIDGTPKMPVPMAEILMYGLVGVGFVSAMTYVIGFIAPMQRIRSLRLLYKLKARVNHGDPEAILAAQSIVACSKPNPIIWKMMTWFWLTTVITITLWFVLVSINVVKDYTRTLEITVGCE